MNLKIPNLLKRLKKQMADSQVDARFFKCSDVDSLLDWTNTTSGVEVSSFCHTVIKRDRNKFKCDNICYMYGVDWLRNTFFNIIRISSMQFK